MSSKADQDLFLAPNRYFDRHFQREAVKILPGEYYVTQQGAVIVTVLGSCISACIRDADTGVGGMNHFLLPTDERTSGEQLGLSARYGAYAMELLINQLLKLGASRYRLEAKIFGGGNVIRGFAEQAVGARNAEFVQEYLKNEGIPILASDVLGSCPRKIYFFPDQGRVMVKKLRNMHNATILERESEYRMRIRNQPQGGSVDLF